VILKVVVLFVEWKKTGRKGLVAVVVEAVVGKVTAVVVFEVAVVEVVIDKMKRDHKVVVMLPEDDLVVVLVVADTPNL